jgi:hypothetical protein
VIFREALGVALIGSSTIRAGEERRSAAKKVLKDVETIFKTMLDHFFLKIIGANLHENVGATFT